MNNISDTINTAVDALSSPESLEGLFHQVHDNVPLPSNASLAEIVELARAIFFPGYFGQNKVTQDTIKYHVGVAIERFARLLKKQVMAGMCFCMEENEAFSVSEVRAKAQEITEETVRRLPKLRGILATYMESASNGNPAATSFGEIISCYPVIRTLTNYRLAHELHLLGVPLIPRMISELAHSETGIDIHPKATIGDYFTIDHGTGIVIGETCVIGRHVKLYQGVTLGAKSFPLDSQGNPIKGIPRHPILEDNVVVYANATILGRITIGEGCVVGANTWVMEDMAPQTKKYNKKQ